MKIINTSLGYKINCQLEYFEKKNHITRFHIKARFRAMPPSGRKERRKWKKNREAAYQGSSTHFFRSLIDGNHKREGFRIYTINDRNEFVEAMRNDFLQENESGLFWKLCFKGTLFVDYVKEVESREYLYYTLDIEGKSDLRLGALKAKDITPGCQRSELELKENEVVLFSNGQVQKPANIIKRGYWSWERVADLMPNDYTIKN